MEIRPEVIGWEEINVSTLKSKKITNVDYVISPLRTIKVSVGDKVVKGQFLTDGSANIQDIFKLAGLRTAEDYIISEVVKIYEMQGASISQKHIEVIVRQMFSRRKVTNAGETKFSVGEIIEKVELDEENARIEKDGGMVGEADKLVLGISEVSLTTKSWLSAASFQHTTRVLINAAVEGQVDHLRGLKENVIVGRLIPAGTGFKGVVEDTEDESESEKSAEEKS